MGTGARAGPRQRSGGEFLNLDRIENIADAVLYEGYMLYPYRPSSIKNQKRWNFGVLYPPHYCEQQEGLDRCSMQTECLIKAYPASRVTVKVRFLQIVQRTIGKLLAPAMDVQSANVPAFERVDHLEVAGRVYQPWQDAIERDFVLHDLDPRSLPCSPSTFFIPEGKTSEFLCDEQGLPVGVIEKKWNPLCGSVEISSENCRDGIVKLRVKVHNLTRSVSQAELKSAIRESVLLDSLVSAHTILSADNGEFISLLEPPAYCADLVADCNNLGTWPVLAGSDASCVLSSPIILYDHPQIAPESAGTLFDSTEIDEILSLRILTLTDAEKQEMRQSDDRTREILERTENMPEEQFMKLHGVLRGLTTVSEELS